MRWPIQASGSYGRFSTAAGAGRPSPAPDASLCLGASALSSDFADKPFWMALR